MNDFEEIFKIIKIIQSSRLRNLTDEENKLLDSWLDSNNENRELFDSLVSERNVPKKMKELEVFDKQAAFRRFSNSYLNRRRKISITIIKYAAIIIPVLLASYFIYNLNRNSTEAIEVVDSNVHPGSSKAVLKLADGTTINLEDETKEIEETDGTLISTDKKKIVYSADEKKVKPRQIKYNTIEIPRGGEYQLTLSDGTHVWLNAETVIKYPVVFSKDRREVYIEGEAYFEVARDEQLPFIVHTSNMDINVLGTGFNVRAYSSENKAVTTLVHGEVSIGRSYDSRQFTLKPNEQAIFSEDEGKIVHQVDVNQFVAWKDGRIYYEDNTLDEICKDLSRWYNVSIDYADDDVKRLRFSIDMKRYDKFSDILEIINLTKKVKFKIEEDKITVSKN